MYKKGKYDIGEYFSKEFWNIHNKVSQRLLTKIAMNPDVTADNLRKPLPDLKQFREIYDEVVYDANSDGNIINRILI